MADGLSAAGAKLYIGGSEITDPDSQELADYTGETWTQVSRVQDFGSIGDTREVATYREADVKRVKRISTYKDGGAPNMVFTFDDSDAGQAALIAAEGKNYAFKIEYDNAASGSPQNGTTLYFTAMPTSNDRNLGDGTAVTTRTVALQINSDVLEVAAV